VADAEITVARRTMRIWAYKQAEVLVDGELIGALRWRRDRIRVTLNSGNHTLQGRLGVLGSPQLDVDLAAGDRRNFVITWSRRIGISADAASNLSITERF
jgi:hypothetical protein